MPTPTTEAAIKAAVVSVVEAMEPRTTRAQSCRWKYFAQRTQPKQGLRWFTVRIESVGFTDGGLFGQSSYSVDAVLSVIADYGGVPEHELDALASDDHYQLHDVLNTIRSGLDGLRFLTSAGWDSLDGDLADQVQIVHQYELTFLRPRA